MHVVAQLDKGNRPVRIFGDAHDRLGSAQQAMQSVKVSSSAVVSVLSAQDIVIEGDQLDCDSLQLLEPKAEGYDPYNKPLTAKRR